MKLNSLSDEMAFRDIRRAYAPVSLMLICLVFMFTGCANESLVPDGYWRFDPPTQARILKNAVIKTEDDQVLVLTYFGGPVLNKGVNTETTEKQLLGHMRCGQIVSSDNGLKMHLDARYELAGHQEGSVLSEVFSIAFAEDGSLRVEGLMNFPDVAYVRTEELTNEEALVFQQYSEACNNQ